MGILMPERKPSNKTGLTQKNKNMKNINSNAPVASFQIHPLVQKTYREKDLDSLSFTLEKYGQQTPVKVVERSGQMYIIDGVSRFKVATQLRLPSLIYEVVEVPDDKIMEYRMVSNVKTKRSFIEMCFEVEYVLNILGSSQGRKRKLFGFSDFDNDNNFGEFKKDRFYLACALLGIEMKGSTLRKAMKVFWSEFDPKGKSDTGIIELLDKGRITIDKAYSLTSDKQRKEKELKKIAARNYEGQDTDVTYRLFCKSSLNMDDVVNESVTLCIQSPPYFQIKPYRNQGTAPHGQEKTSEEYINKEVEFCREVRKKLKPNGVFVLIVGETYRNGYQGICSKLELALEKDGWQILDVNIWVKENPKPTGHPMRFLNGYERIIVLCKDGAKPEFRSVTKPSKNKKLKVIRGTQLVGGECGHSIGSTQASITNVITTPAFNKSEWKDVDPNFQHDAPCPSKIYQIFIDAYSEPSDLILDGFCGSSLGLGYGISKGRSVVGFDIDPVSIDFSRKLLEKRLADRSKNPLRIAA